MDLPLGIAGPGSSSQPIQRIPFGCNFLQRESCCPAAAGWPDLRQGEGGGWASHSSSLPVSPSGASALSAAAGSLPHLLFLLHPVWSAPSLEREFCNLVQVQARHPSTPLPRLTYPGYPLCAIPSSARPAMQLYLGQTVFISVMPLLLATGSRLSEALTCRRSYSQYLAHTEYIRPAYLDRGCPSPSRVPSSGSEASCYLTLYNHLPVLIYLSTRPANSTERGRVEVDSVHTPVVSEADQHNER